MAIAGIEGLAQGFMQGMAIKRQNDRQDVLDAQNLEKFGMDKERFATQQAASAFDLQNAQTNAANAATDRTRTLGLQKKNDDFEANLGRIYGAGTPEGELMELEKIHQGSGVKGAWARDPKTGGLAKSADGKFKWVNEDGTAYDASVEDAVGAYIAKVKPLQKAESDMKTASEIAKEKRDVTNSILKGAPKIASDERISRANNASRERQITLQLQYRTKQEKDAAISAFSPYISSARQILRNNKLSAEDLHNMKRDLTKDGFIQEGIRSFNAANATKKLTPEQIKAAQKEVTSLADALYGAAATTTSGTDTYYSASQGDLTVTGGLDKESGAVDMSGRSKLGGQGAAQPTQPASPVSGLTVKPQVQDKGNTEVAIPAKPVSKTQVLTKISGMRGSEKITKTNNPYQEIQGKFGDPIPNGFKRKKASWDADVRSPEYNVFVSNNYQD